MIAHRLHQFVFDVGNDVSLLPVLFDQLMKSITVGYPTNETCILAEWYNGIPPDRQILFACLGVNGKQCINQAE